MIKRIVRAALEKAGYQVFRRPQEMPRNLVRETCQGLAVPMLEPIPVGAYRIACPPLFPEPTPVSGGEGMSHYRSLWEAVDNISMRCYFQIVREKDRVTITDDYPGSNYYSRQRMLTSVYASSFGPRLDGVRVLDVGCSSGYYSMLCSRLGAGRVLGIDSRPEHEDQFSLLHHMLSLPESCAYRNVDMECEMENLSESFDLVLAQGVMYHVYDHPRFIRNLYRLTRRVLILEGACSGRADCMCKPDVEETDFLRASIHGPVLYPSLPWMVALLRWAGFKQVNYVMYPSDLPPSAEHAGLWRAMLVAKK